MDITNLKKIYFVGIGGIAMSAVAGLARQAGYEVEGSDSSEIYSPSKEVLEDEGITYFHGYDSSHIQNAQADLYVLSAGEGEQNPEVKYILEHGLARCGFPELAYELTKERLRVVVAGTHGKSTTSGLIGHLLKGLDDSAFMVGGVLQNYGSNFHSGQGHYFVFEGDEYKSEFDDPTPKFHYYKPDILVLTNLEWDHPDLFPTFEAMQEEFRQLINNMPADGLIVYNADDEHVVKLVHESNVSSVSFGLDDAADFWAEQLDFGPEFTEIKVKNKFTKDQLSQALGLLEEYKIQLPGKINVYNALAAIAMLRALGFSPNTFSLDLLTYKGIKRRFEDVGRRNGVTFINDYAHHPTAVKETLEAARLRYPQAALWAVFEPHTFSRTKALLNELSLSFKAADQVLLANIYPAREKASDAGITSEQVLAEVQKQHPHVRLMANKQEAIATLNAETKPGDVVVVMAVGNFNRLAYDMVEQKNDN